MGKIVKGIVMVVAVVALTVFAAPALAGVLAGTLGTALAKVAAALIVGAVIAGAQMLLMPKPKALNSSMIDRLNISVNPTAPRKIAFGRTAAGADERFHEKVSRTHSVAWATAKGDYFYRVIALASHKVHRVHQVYLEDELSYNNGATTGKFATASGIGLNGLRIDAVTEGSASNARAFGSGSYWTSSASFTGCAYILMMHKLDDKVYPDGLPSRITTVVEGCPVFDPRRSTMFGGSMVATDQNTWGWSVAGDEIGRNPALILLTYLIGWRINGHLVWGMGVPVERIDLNNFITYANVCDEAVLTKAGATIKRYLCDALFDTSMTHESITGAITASMGTTKLSDNGGMYSLVAGFDDLDGPIVEFTEADLIGSYEWKPSVALNERYNSARGRFANPDKLWQLEDWGEVSVAPLADGIPRPLVVEFAAISRAETCQRIAKQMLARNQFTGAFVSTFGPKAFTVQVGSLVYMTVAKEGWNRKLFRVIDHSESVEMMFQMTLQEESAIIYQWDRNEAIELPADIRPPAWNALEVTPVEAVAASSRTIDNSSGGADSYIDVTWVEPDAAVTVIQFQTRESSGTIWQDCGSTDHRAELHTFRSVSSGIGHDVRARFRMFSGIWGPWTEPVQIVAAVGVGVSSVNGILTDENVTFAVDANGNVL